ncbi:FecR family protein [Aureivirga marina]|uniref:FecR family protein n=1 Tax=Aureivirga marina TaxID=1182451 RepID=UPI0018CB44FE|nr:FecR family protein [Aureivirga marina]
MENIEVLIVKYLQNHLSPKEKDEVDTWRKKNLENEKVFQDIQIIWKESKDLKYFDSDKAWKKIKPKKKKSKLIYITGFSIAASIALLFSIWHLNSDKTTNKTLEFATLDLIKEIYLPDSSKVILNKNSTITFNEKQENSREVFLKGEAFFEVKKSKIPFIVSTKTTKTEVLGTKFTVQTTKDSTFVFVEEGKVSFSELNLPEKEVILTKNDIGIFNNNKQKIEKKITTTNQFSTWYNNTLIFNHSPFLEVISIIQQKFNIQIQVENPMLENEFFSAKIRQPNKEKVFEALKLAFNCEIIKSEKGYIIR